jgi:sugar O-acyltransferase (sialic acid O-acetyltransferase NeuD family)
MTDSIVLFGAGGHAKQVMCALTAERRHSVAWVVDDDPVLQGTEILGVPVVTNRAEFLRAAHSRNIAKSLVAVGNNGHRIHIMDWLRAQGFELISVIHPAACVDYTVLVGSGSMIMAGAIIDTNAVIGSGVIVNSGATVCHDNVLADGVHIGPGCSLCGNVSVGALTLIGAGTTIIPGMTVGTGSVVGAGSVVIEPIPDHVLAVGNPCRIVRSLFPGSEQETS